MPIPHSGSLTSSACVIGSGTIPDSNNRRQNRFVGPAKWWPVEADITPGLIPTSSTRTPGSIRSVSRSSAQLGFRLSALGFSIWS